MAAEVLVEDVHAGEFLGAAGDGAGVGLLPSVGADVHDELHLGGEGLAQSGTVLPQAGGGQRVAARVAVDVVVQDVLPEHRNVIKAALAPGPVTHVLLLRGGRGGGGGAMVVVVAVVLGSGCSRTPNVPQVNGRRLRGNTQGHHGGGSVDGGRRGMTRSGGSARRGKLDWRRANNHYY